MNQPAETAAPTLEDVRAAARRIAPLARRTPVLTSSGLDQLSGARVFFKCENFQRTGSFKIRGASNAVLSLSEEQARRGVVAHSSGNHASALACAARHRGIRADIVIPNNAPLSKRETTEAFGGIVHLCEPTMVARNATVEALQQKTGATLVHPYDNATVIAGQGTATLELLDEIPALDTVVAPSVVPSAAAFEIVSVPPDTVVAPEYVFVPDSARSPVPVFVRAPVSEMTPEKDVDPLLPPVVNVAVPSVTEPAPAMDPMVSDTSFKSNVPVIVIADESGTLPESDNITVPAEIVVELV